MRRAQAFEIGDWDRLPRVLHDAMTLVLRVCYRQLHTDEWRRKIEAALARTGSREVLDLCSGGGGPWLDLARAVKAPDGSPAAVTLSDLRPNALARALVNGDAGTNLRYRAAPLDAAQIPPELKARGPVRTMFAGFHHLPPAVAHAVLRDAFESRAAILVFEGTTNTALGILLTALMPLNTLLLTPFVRPLRLSQILLTYVVPVIPLIMGIDGVLSARRTYSPAELRDLTQGLSAPDYEWTTGLLRSRWVPLAFPYLTGLPCATGLDDPKIT